MKAVHQGAEVEEVGAMADVDTADRGEGGEGAKVGEGVAPP